MVDRVIFVDIDAYPSCRVDFDDMPSCAVDENHSPGQALCCSKCYGAFLKLLLGPHEQQIEVRDHIPSRNR